MPDIEIRYYINNLEKKLQSKGYQTDSGWDNDWFEYLNIGKDGFWFETDSPDVEPQIYIKLGRSSVKGEERQFLKDLFYEVSGNVYKDSENDKSMNL